MANFNYLEIDTDFYANKEKSPSFIYKNITDKCELNRDVWIKYFNNNVNSTHTFELSDSLGGISVIMFYVKNEDETYNVYSYDGILRIQRTIQGNNRDDSLLNLEDIIVELKDFLRNN
ncbi:MAG: hypothetical protein IKQ72_08445 [Bacteroidaceae bacterium]|nr:hypothetical protein [Bacteroidaceae bacterium]